MLNKDESVIIKFDFSVEQTVGQITKITGFMKAKYLISIIDILDLKANPRSSKTGPVTTAIQDLLKRSKSVFRSRPKEFCLPLPGMNVLNVVESR